MDMGYELAEKAMKIALPGSLKAVFMNLCYRDKNGACHPFTKTIANDIGRSLRTVKTCVKRLDDIGIVSVIRTGRANRYIIAPPETWADLLDKYQKCKICISDVKENPAYQMCDDSTSEVRNLHIRSAKSALPYIKVNKDKRKVINSSRSAMRLSSDWMLSFEDLHFCRQKRPDLNPQVLFKKFLNYYTVGKGKDIVKDDWSLTWREWVIREDTNIPAVKTEESWGGFMSRVANQKEERVIDAECTLLLG